MASNMALGTIHFPQLVLVLLLFIFLCVTDAKYGSGPMIYNLKTYGAIADGNSDISEVFLKAWSDACQWNGKSLVVIPRGTYKLSSVVLMGPCRGATVVVIKGVLRAPNDPAEFFSDHWISFQYVDQLVVRGGGFLDGQGASAWPYNDCINNPLCQPLPVTMRFDFVTNSRVHHLRSINSKNAHFNLFACKNMNISHVRMTCPADSPNTDGIHIGDSTNIRISRTVIGTGDDCISMISGTRNVDISEVSCGPGHGISIGSLGKSNNNELVSGINVKNCSFSRTENGLRIKTWAPSLSSLASDFMFESIRMERVNNPIIIDQNYCPTPPCNDQAQSSIQISNVTFRNIWGTSSSKVAVYIKCSEAVPCQNINLEDINLAYNGRGGAATSSCSNANGQLYGKQLPPGCL